jgi:hypothetical protein
VKVAIAAERIRVALRTLIAAGAIIVATRGAVFAANQGLWVANGTNVLEFTTASGVHDSKPKVVLRSHSFGAAKGVVFDPNGNLWVIDAGNGGNLGPSLEEFTQKQIGELKKHRTPTPNVQITSSSFVFPEQAAFDANGNMWVSDSGANAIYALTPAQLAAGGETDLTTVIESDPAFAGPIGIALHGGNLYVANNSSDTIFGFNSSHLPVIGSGASMLVPDVVLDNDGVGPWSPETYSIQSPWGLAFDADGDLFASNVEPPNLVCEFAAEQIAASGAPTPVAVLNAVLVHVSKKVFVGILNVPNGLAIDQNGNLAAISSAEAPRELFGIAEYVLPFVNFGGIPPETFIAGKKTNLKAPAGAIFGPEIK